MRGTAAVAEAAGQLGRITPACAGNRYTLEIMPHFLQDHPRVCGEQIMGVSRPTVEKGSPPRVRGTGGHFCGLYWSGRITPACAGNSFTSVIGRKLKWDHPRVCGEQLLIRCLFQQKPGSPPRVRGTVYPRKQAKMDARITPACAGNRPSTRQQSGSLRDHPRVCGEQACRCFVIPIL